MHPKYRQKPVTSGEWNRVAKQHYRHFSGVEVIYRPNSWLWEVVGGKEDGRCYQSLSAAQHAATYVRCA